MRGRALLGFTRHERAATAAAIVAALQGGYVLARAADSATPFEQAVEGILALLTAHTIH
ncbi:hypothetical protein OH799_05775 [Nocardia sp. NBC_00881]|uniref:hypothetical protein n=1 Tax=Nocardia sp. NBC_00881 TaxID=2975995 RepID=UPI00386685FC|nr:hypothetical protein OH799_05775 [Nocardia sp. NBC_00881]